MSLADFSSFIESETKKIDAFDMRKILTSSSNENAETLYMFLNGENNYIQTKMSLEHAFYIFRNDRVHSDNLVLFEDLNWILASLNKGRIRELNKAQIRFAYLLVIYSFVLGIYDSLEIKTENDFKINLSSRTSEEEITSANQLIVSSDGLFYRGQTKDCKMSPSILRQLNKQIEINRYSYEYLADKKIEKMDKVFPKTRGIYETMSYIQHSTNYSPFLDFTTNKLVAGVFALSNSNNVNEFNNEDSVIVGIKRIGNGFVDNVKRTIEEANEFLNNTNECYIRVINAKSITLFKKYVFHTYERSGKRIFKSEITFKSYGDIYRELTPKYVIFDIKSNDRMKYQSGVFLMFYRCVSLQDRIYYEFNPYFSLVKTYIRKLNKHFVLSEIFNNYREHDLNHLMDPYLIFKE